MIDYKQFIVILSWAILLSTVLTHSLLNQQPWILFWASIALVSFSAGVLIVDLETTVIGWFMALGLCVVIMFLELSLPALLGVLSYQALNDLVYAQAVKMIFSSIFPVTLIITSVSSLVGTYIGERFSV